jgi:hypothetical protein
MTLYFALWHYVISFLSITLCFIFNLTFLNGLIYFYMPRGRGVRRGRVRPPVQGRVLRGKTVEQHESLNRPVDRRRRRGVDEHRAWLQIEPHGQPQLKQFQLPK